MSFHYLGWNLQRGAPVGGGQGGPAQQRRGPAWYGPGGAARQRNLVLEWAELRVKQGYSMSAGESLTEAEGENVMNGSPTGVDGKGGGVCSHVAWDRRIVWMVVRWERQRDSMGEGEGMG